MYQQDDLDVIIGDMDSLREEVRDYYTTLPRRARIVLDADQFSTDFGKAVVYVRRNSAVAGQPLDIVAWGEMGGRVDQCMAQLHQLYLSQGGKSGDTEETGRLFLATSSSLTFLLRRGKHHIRVREEDRADGEQQQCVFGRHVGILPLAGPCAITTSGLEWDIVEWRTQFGGQLSTSNHLLPGTEVVKVDTDGDVLFTMAWAEAEAEEKALGSG